MTAESEWRLRLETTEDEEKSQMAWVSAGRGWVCHTWQGFNKGTGVPARAYHPGTCLKELEGTHSGMGRLEMRGRHAREELGVLETWADSKSLSSSLLETTWILQPWKGLVTSGRDCRWAPSAEEWVAEAHGPEDESKGQVWALNLGNNGDQPVKCQGLWPCLLEAPAGHLGSQLLIN